MDYHTKTVALLSTSYLGIAFAVAYFPYWRLVGLTHRQYLKAHLDSGGGTIGGLLDLWQGGDTAGKLVLFLPLLTVVFAVMVGGALASIMTTHCNLPQKCLSAYFATVIVTLSVRFRDMELARTIFTRK